jgi:hypothetical protein
MAGVERKWTKTLTVAVLLLGAGTADFAQSARTHLVEDGPSGSLIGKLTDLHSNPLEGVEVVARNQATGAEARTTTIKNGIYRFSGLTPGEYSVTAESPQLGRGQVEWIVVNGGHEARVQTAILLTPLPSSPDLAALPGEELPRLNRPILEPETLLANNAALSAEPLILLPLAGQSLPNIAPPAPAVSRPARTIAIGSQVTEAGTGMPAPVASSPAFAAVLGSQVPKSEGPGAPSTLLPGANEIGQAASGAVQTPLHPPVPAATADTGPQAAAQPVTVPSKPALAASQASEPAVPALSSTMSAAELQALPVSGRRWQDFVLDNTPTSTTPAGGQGEISLRGAGQPAEIAVDGVNRGLAFGRTNESGQGSSGRGLLGQGENPAGMAQVGTGGHGLAMSEAAIRTVETVAGNVEAAVDRAAGGRMNVETERGANELHGQGFLFDRQNSWGARNPFTQWVKETTPANGTTVPIPVFTSESYTPPDRETTWGIGLGSRILRNKLFWFAALDGYNRNDPGLATVKHPYLCTTYNANGQCSVEAGFFAQPTNDQMNVLCARLGLIEPGQTGTPEACTNALVQGLGVYSTMLETLAGLLGPAPRTATQWTGFGRLDWQATERNRFTLEGIGARWNSPGGGLTRVAETYGNHSFGSSEASEEWLLGRWEVFITPNLLAVTQASVGRAVQEARPETPSTLDNFEQSLLSGNVWGQLPQIVVDNRYGFTIGNPSRFGQGSYPDEKLYHGQESVDWIRGKLMVKAGFELSHNSDATSLLRNQTGTYTYSNVENFISDALVFENPILRSDPLDPYHQHNCDETGKAWRDSGGGLRGVGNLPCYSYYSQTMGPSSWHLSTNDWAGYATAQWEASKRVVLSAGLRWEREQLPPPLAALQNTELPLTEKQPSLGNNWGPRVSLAVGSGETHWPVLRLGYGMYFGRTENLTVETALTQTGSLNGDLNFFMRPTDDLPNNGGGAPPFPYVLQGEPGSAVMPGAVEFAPNFHNPEVHQAVVGVEETLPSHVEVFASAMVSLGRRLPISIDTNFDSPTSTQSITYAVVDGAGAGPIKAAQITVPFYASWPSATSSTGFAGRLNPDYQQITQIMSRANSTYEAMMVKVVRYGRRGLSLHAHYTYAHAMDWNPNESSQVAGNDVLDPADFSEEYGTSNLDVRHSASAMAVYEAPWKLRGTAGKFGNGWMASGVAQFRSGLPYTMRTSGSLPEEFDTTTGAAIVGLGPGMNGSGGDNRVYGVGNDNIVYNIGRNTYRYPATWKADLRLGRRFDLGHMRQLELLAESFNLFNHQNVTELETTGYYIESGSTSSLPTLNFLSGPMTNPTTGLVTKANITAFGQPLNINATNFYRERQIQFGLRLRF